MAGFTEKAIKETFWELLEERPLHQIRVKDIVERCGINRNTFYYHFADIPSLLEGIIIEQADTIISRYPELDSLLDCVNAAVDFAEVNRRSVLHIYQSANRPLFEEYLWQVCERVVTAYVQSATSDRDLLDEVRQSIIAQFVWECFGVVMGWMRSGMDGEIHRVINQIWMIRKEAIPQLLDRAEEISRQMASGGCRPTGSGKQPASETGMEDSGQL